MQKNNNNNPVTNSPSRLRKHEKLHSTENPSFAMGHRLKCTH